MKILIISNSEVLENQGSGYVIVNTAKSLEVLGHEVKIIHPSEFSILSFLKSKATNYRRALGIGKWIITNSKRIDNYNIVVFYGAESSLGLFLMQKILRKKAKTILHSNGLELHVDFITRYFKDYLPDQKKWYNFDQKLLFKYCYYNVTGIITVSEYDKLFAINNLGIPAYKVFVNEPFLPDIYFAQLDYKLFEKKKIITFCGSWIARKGVNILKQVIPSILKNNPDYTFRLIGVGNGFKKEEHFPQEILPRIELYPLVNDKKELIELYKDTDIFLFPSFCESFGLVIAEAMLYNCAVVCGPTGIATTLENKKDAVVLSIPNGIAVMEAVTELIQNPVLKKYIQLNASEKIKVFNKQNYINKLEKIINRVICLPTK